MKVIGIDYSSYAEKLNSIEITKIDNLHFCMGYTDNENGKVTLGIIIAAHIASTNELIGLAQNWSLEHKELEYGTLLSSGLIMHDDYADKYTQSMAAFFIDGKDYYITDFLTQYNETTKEYEFYACKNDEDSIRKFSIAKSVNVGLNMMVYSLIKFNINKNSIMNINDWLSNRVNSLINAEFSIVKNFELLDKSRTIKESRNVHSGAAVVKFTVSTVIGVEKEYTCVMGYSIDKPIKDRNNTKDLRLLEQIYGGNCYSILSNRGIFQVGKCMVFQLIAFDKNYNYIVLEIGSLSLEKLYDQIRE